MRNGFKPCGHDSLPTARMMNLSFYIDKDHWFSKSFGSVSVPVFATKSILPGCLVRRSAKGGDLEVE